MTLSCSQPPERDGEYWIDKCHFGDCRDLMAEMPEGIADSCITDPPYGDTSLEWDRQCGFWIEYMARVLKPTASAWVFGSMRFIAQTFSEMQVHGFKFAQDIVWEKQNGSGLHNDRFRRVHEYAVQFYRGVWADVYKEPQFTQDATARTLRRKTRPTHFGEVAGSDATYSSEDGGPRLQRSVIYQANEHGKAFHPTQKPLGILAPLIAYSVPPGGVVIDPFLGSGSTAIAARQLGRHWIGCENDPTSMAAQDERFRQSDLLTEIA